MVNATPTFKPGVNDDPLLPRDPMSMLTGPLSTDGLNEHEVVDNSID